MMQTDQMQASSDANVFVDVFVYGTLRRGEINDITRAAARHRIDAPRLLGTASMPGRVFDLGNYPGLVPLAGGAAGLDAVPGAAMVATDVDQAAPSVPLVMGDVYRVAPALLPVLDEIEGIRSDGREAFYRDECHLSVGGVLHRCLFYPIDPEVAESRPLIEGGDWIAYRIARTAA